jgi:hypothetical protein
MKTPKQILEDCCGYTQREQTIDDNYEEITTGEALEAIELYHAQFNEGIPVEKWDKSNSTCWLYTPIGVQMGYYSYSEGAFKNRYDEIVNVTHAMLFVIPQPPKTE